MKNFITEAKNFKRQMGWISIMCLIGTLMLSYQAPQYIGSWFVVPVGGFIFTYIWFTMKSNIDNYERMKSKAEQDKDWFMKKYS